MTIFKISTPSKLNDRALILVTGKDAAEFLQGQISNDVDLLKNQTAIHGLILTPQGKILTDLFVYAYQGGYLLDIHSSVKDWLISRFNMFKLRSEVNFADHTEALQIIISTDALDDALISTPDPRIATIYRNIFAIENDFPAQNNADYQHYMASQALIEFATDYQASEHFPQDLWFDKLSSVSFSKGCYVGQEVVSRMRHKSTARKRLLPLISDAPHQKGDKILLADKSVGEVITQVGNITLAMMRIDKLPDNATKLDDFEIVRPEWIQN